MYAVKVGECLRVECQPQDPIFKGNKVPNTEMGYPGGPLLHPAASPPPQDTALLHLGTLWRFSNLWLCARHKGFTAWVVLRAALAQGYRAPLLVCEQAR